MVVLHLVVRRELRWPLPRASTLRHAALHVRNDVAHDVSARDVSRTKRARCITNGTRGRGSPWRLAPEARITPLPLNAIQCSRRHRTCDVRERATSAPAELGGGTSQCLAKSSQYAGPSAGAYVARLRKWHAWCLLVVVAAQDGVRSARLRDVRRPGSTTGSTATYVLATYASTKGMLFRSP